MIKYYLNKLSKISCSPSIKKINKKKKKGKKKSILKRKVGNKLNVHFFLFIKLFYRIISFTILIIQNSRNISIEILKKYKRSSKQLVRK